MALVELKTRAWLRSSHWTIVTDLLGYLAVVSFHMHVYFDRKTPLAQWVLGLFPKPSRGAISLKRSII